MKQQTKNLLSTPIPIFLILLGLCIFFISCPPPSNGGGSGKKGGSPTSKDNGQLTVQLSGADDETGHKLYFRVFNNGDDPDVDDPIAWGEADIDANGDATCVAYNETVDVTFAEGKVLDIYLMVDLNDNFDTGTDYPEEGEDVVAMHEDLQINGNTTAAITFNEFSLYVPDMINYGYGIKFILLLSLYGAPDNGIDKNSVGFTTTYTFTNWPYTDQVGPVVNGTIADTDDGTTSAAVSVLTFTNDPMGLTTISNDSSGPSGGSHDNGTITINGDVRPITEMQKWLDYAFD